VFVVLIFFPAAFGLRYLFGWRHGLTHIFLIIPTVPYLLGRSRVWAWSTAAVLAISIALGARTVFASIAYGPELTLRPPERSLVAFLAEHQRPPRVLTTNAQILGAMSDAHFHWTDCNSPGESTRAMVERLKIDYVVAYEGDKRCAFVDGVFDYLRIVQVFQDERSRVSRARAAIDLDHSLCCPLPRKLGRARETRVDEAIPNFGSAHCAIAAAIEDGSPGSQYTAAAPATSGIDETWLVITGQPWLIASSTGTKPS
jgi:hypothetical protein